MVWKFNPSTRLTLWKELREKCDQLDLESALQETADFWCSCPWTPFYLDEENPSKWPTPWDLLAENYYCQTAVAYGICSTIYLTKHCPDVKLQILEEDVTGSTICISIVNDKYVLNMNSGEVLNRQYIKVKFRMKHSYTAADLKLHTYT